MQEFVNNFESFTASFKEILSSVTEKLTVPLGYISNIYISTAIIISVFVCLLAYSCIKYRHPLSQGISKTKLIVISALIIALNVVISYFRIDVTPTLRITFGFITGAMAGTLFGPIIGCIVLILQDIITFILKPSGSYLYTLTLSNATAGMFWGIFLYKKKLTLWRVILAEIVISLITNLFLNSLALAPLSGAGLVGMLPARIVKELVFIPIKIALIYIVLKAMKRVKI